MGVVMGAVMECVMGVVMGGCDVSGGDEFLGSLGMLTVM